MKTMTPDFVTTKTFNKSMQSIDSRFDAVDSRFEAVDRRFDAVDSRFEAVDRRFEAVDRRFDSIDQEFKIVHRDIADLRVMIRETMEEQRVFFTGEMKQYIGVVIEEFNERFKALYEHPVFANHKA